jgi:hypothetical protein
MIDMATVVRRRRQVLEYMWEDVCGFVVSCSVIVSFVELGCVVEMESCVSVAAVAVGLEAGGAYGDGGDGSEWGVGLRRWPTTNRGFDDLAQMRRLDS